MADLKPILSMWRKEWSITGGSGALRSLNDIKLLQKDYSRSISLSSGTGSKDSLLDNIYNTAVIHGVIELGLEKSVKELPGFFNRVTYEIGGFHFSLNEMEHGILRGNRRHPYGF